jgi:hypothetical protein
MPSARDRRIMNYFKHNIPEAFVRQSRKHYCCLLLSNPYVQIESDIQFALKR